MHTIAAEIATFLKTSDAGITLARDEDGGECDFVAERDGQWIADVHVGHQGGCFDTMPEHVHVYDTRGRLFCEGSAATAVNVLALLGAR